MTPEILHRCQFCGAVIREDAMFCPECGKALAAAKADQPDGNETAAQNTEASAAAPDSANIAASTTHQDVKRQAVAAGAEPVTSSSTSSEGPKSLSQEKHSARERTRETLHRASTVARGA